MQMALMNDKSANIIVPILDFILTPISCAHLVNEVMKNLLYQRSQIPYPYVWLKSIVHKKRNTDHPVENVKNFTLMKHYQLVSSAFDHAETIMGSLLKLFAFYGAALREVIFLIGVSPICPKEVFSIDVTSITNLHIDRNHSVSNSKKQQKILRSLFLENQWMSLIENAISCTNIYTFVKISDHREIPDSVFIPCKPLFYAPQVKRTVIRFDYAETESFTCCDNRVFTDEGSDNCRTLASETQCQDRWLQATLKIQGFKDCFINKVSASQLW